MILARHRPFDLGPARPLVEQSPVLARLAREPRGTRTLDPARNLFMIAGVDPVSAYRTLDLPAPTGMIQLATGRLAGPKAVESMRLLGVDLRVLDPLESRGLPLDAFEFWWGRVESIHDPALAGWMLGVDYARAAGLEDFIMLRPKEPAARAWLMPSDGLEAADGMVNPQVLLDRFRAATPLPFRSDLPERAEVDLTVTDRSPSMVVLSCTFDPEWQAWWVGPSGDRRPAEVVKVLGGWQGVAIPEPGRWTLHLEYEGRAARIGLAVSAVAWIVWIVAVVRLKPRPVDAKTEGGS